MPSELGALANLQSFWASGNNLSGCVVPSLEGSLRDQERVGAPWCAESNQASGAPAIVGTSNAGDQLSATVGAIAGPEGAPEPSAVSWQWQRCDRNGGACTDLEATNRQYVVVEADAGATLRVLASFNDAEGAAQGPLASAAILAPLPRNVETTWQQPDPLRASELFRTESGLRGVLRLEGERWLRYALFGGGQRYPAPSTSASPSATPSGWPTRRVADSAGQLRLSSPAIRASAACRWARSELLSRSFAGEHAVRLVPGIPGLI